MKTVAKYDSKHDGGSVELSIYPLGNLGGGEELAIYRRVQFSDPKAMGGLGVAHALAIRAQDWPALRVAIDEMLAPKPDKHAALHAAMRKTPR